MKTNQLKKKPHQNAFLLNKVLHNGLALGCVLKVHKIHEMRLIH